MRTGAHLVRLFVAILVAAIVIAVALLVVVLYALSSLPLHILKHSVSRYVEIDLEYLYLRIRKVSENIPLLGGKTLIEYVAIVRVENPYRDPFAIDLVQISLPDSVEVDPQCKLNESVSPGYTSFVVKHSCGYGYTNDLLLGSGHILFNDRTRYTSPVLGVGKPFNVAHVAVTGLVEVPSLWMHRLKALAKPIYVLIVVEGRYKELGAVDTTKVLRLSLEQISSNEYVYINMPKELGMHVRGTSVVTEFYVVNDDAARDHREAS